MGLAAGMSTNDTCGRPSALRIAYGNTFCLGCWKQVLEDLHDGRMVLSFESMQPIELAPVGSKCSCRRLRQYRRHGGTPYRCCQE